MRLRYAAAASVLILLALQAWAKHEGWFTLPDTALQALLLGLPVTFLPLYLEGLREGRLVMPPSVIHRRKTPLLFWFVAVFQAIAIAALLVYLGAGLLRSLGAD
ncbi:MAG: hypothetical protein QHC78_03030 [Pigmentiphaga sp.]|uniref:hypothetical protein n=1 Tax=Pigmentiphaga sp. TaxID=1977564 RepID=UPI0029AB35DC|nr:hypothetical protein [Pigmentiphaga sp.]MDX3904647.1 hypothetical protein [Pigmentiphaga sp.]